MPLLLHQNATLRETLATVSADERYTLRNVRLNAWLTEMAAPDADEEGFTSADLSIAHGKIVAVTPADGNKDVSVASHGQAIDLCGRVVLPRFIDCHTHLDKGHILPRTTGIDGTFATARALTMADREAHWTADDVARRMDFALRSAWHHGTAAIRTHIDSQPPQDEISWPVFAEMRRHWRGRIALQAAALIPIDLARDAAFLDGLARRVSAAGGILGAFAYPLPDLDPILDRFFAVATRYGLDLDFHADETADPAADALRAIARAARRANFAGRVLVGHCCSLAMQDDATVDRTLDEVAGAGLAVVSLPTCNLYLQDRRPGAGTPRWRGVTLLHEMKARGIAVALASDNTRDPFHAYGDLDMLDTYRLGTRVLHLDHPTGDWPRAIASARPCAPPTSQQQRMASQISSLSANFGPDAQTGTAGAKPVTR
ncbi:MAG: cytosine deaminase, partial [Nitratireductor sp.]|nr:cytosine deaminase [Nitratireductor sp.]